MLDRRVLVTRDILCLALFHPGRSMQMPGDNKESRGPSPAFQRETPAPVTSITNSDGSVVENSALNAVAREAARRGQLRNCVLAHVAGNNSRVKKKYLNGVQQCYRDAKKNGSVRLQLRLTLRAVSLLLVCPTRVSAPPALAIWYAGARIFNYRGRSRSSQPKWQIWLVSDTKGARRVDNESVALV